MTLDIENLYFSYGDHKIINGIELSFESGLNTILGPNGAGKSTLVKCLAGINTPDRGSMSFNGENLINRNKDKVKIAYLSQEKPNIANLTVLEMMLLGISDRLGFRVTDEDLNCAYQPLEKFGVEKFAERKMGELSGGQSQIIHIAQCFVSEPDLIILDEPMNNLDIRKELDMFEIMRAETDARNLTTLVVLHDINFATRYSDNITIMNNGEIYSTGPPSETITEKMFRDVYNIEVEINTNSEGYITVYPIRSMKNMDNL